MAKKKREVLALPPEQMNSGDFQLQDIVDRPPGGRSIVIGKAYRRRPMIDILFDQAVFSEAEYKALRHYRHHADIADRSPLRDSLATIMRIGGGTGMPPSIEILNAVRVRNDCERAAGSLCDILRAVVVADMSLSQWAIARAGAIERCRERRGKRVCQFEPSKKALGIARVEIKMVARRVQAELDA